MEVLANEVEVRCRPSNLPSQIDLDISELALGGNLQIKDLPELEDVAFVADEDTVLVSCVGSASGRSDAEDEVAEEAAEGEAEDGDGDGDGEASDEVADGKEEE